MAEIKKIKGNQHDKLVKSKDIEDLEKYYINDNEKGSYWILRREMIHLEKEKKYEAREIFRSYNKRDYEVLIKDKGVFDGDDATLIIHVAEKLKTEPKK